MYQLFLSDAKFIYCIASDVAIAVSILDYLNPYDLIYSKVRVDLSVFHREHRGL